MPGPQRFGFRDFLKVGGRLAFASAKHHGPGIAKSAAKLGLKTQTGGTILGGVGVSALLIQKMLMAPADVLHSSRMPRAVALYGRKLRFKRKKRKFKRKKRKVKKRRRKRKRKC